MAWSFSKTAHLLTLYTQWITGWIAIFWKFGLVTGLRLINLIFLTWNHLIPSYGNQRRNLCYGSTKSYRSDKSHPGSWNTCQEPTLILFVSVTTLDITMKCASESWRKYTVNCDKVTTTWSDICVKPNVNFKMKKANNFGIFIFHWL
jgi:hypothetical protein